MTLQENIDALTKVLAKMKPPLRLRIEWGATETDGVVTIFDPATAGDAGVYERLTTSDFDEQIVAEYSAKRRLNVISELLNRPEAVWSSTLVVRCFTQENVRNALRLVDPDLCDAVADDELEALLTDTRRVGVSSNPHGDWHYLLLPKGYTFADDFELHHEEQIKPEPQAEVKPLTMKGIIEAVRKFVATMKPEDEVTCGEVSRKVKELGYLDVEPGLDDVQSVLSITPELLGCFGHFKLRHAEQKSEASGDEDELVTVCSSCLQASCWQGEFMCDRAQVASTVDLPVKALRVMARESDHYWKDSDVKLSRGQDCDLDDKSVRDCVLDALQHSDYEWLKLRTIQKTIEERKTTDRVIPLWKIEAVLRSMPDEIQTSASESGSTIYKLKPKQAEGSLDDKSDDDCILDVLQRFNHGWLDLRIIQNEIARRRTHSEIIPLWRLQRALKGFGDKVQKRTDDSGFPVYRLKPEEELDKKSVMDCVRDVLESRPTFWLRPAAIMQFIRLRKTTDKDIPVEAIEIALQDMPDVITRDAMPLDGSKLYRLSDEAIRKLEDKEIDYDLPSLHPDGVLMRIIVIQLQAIKALDKSMSFDQLYKQVCDCYEKGQEPTSAQMKQALLDMMRVEHWYLQADPESEPEPQFRLNKELPYRSNVKQAVDKLKTFDKRELRELVRKVNESTESRDASAMVIGSLSWMIIEAMRNGGKEQYTFDEIYDLTSKMYLKDQGPSRFMVKNAIANMSRLMFVHDVAPVKGKNVITTLFAERKSKAFPPDETEAQECSWQSSFVGEMFKYEPFSVIKRKKEIDVVRELPEAQKGAIYVASSEYEDRKETDPFGVLAWAEIPAQTEEENTPMEGESVKSEAHADAQETSSTGDKTTCPYTRIWYKGANEDVELMSDVTADLAQRLAKRRSFNPYFTSEWLKLTLDAGNQILMRKKQLPKLAELEDWLMAQTDIDYIEQSNAKGKLFKLT